MLTKTLEILQGKYFTQIWRSVCGDVLFFEASDGTQFTMSHNQNCCEHVTIEDINGELSDLVGAPLLMAEEVTGNPREGDKKEPYDKSWTWTFYRFATHKGRVVIRWYGGSNGFYSESVEVKQIK